MSTMELEQVKSTDRFRSIGPQRIYVLTEEDKAALERGRKDYEEGRWIDHDEFMAELDQWLEEKNKELAEKRKN